MKHITSIHLYKWLVFFTFIKIVYPISKRSGECSELSSLEHFIMPIFPCNSNMEELSLILFSSVIFAKQSKRTLLLPNYMGIECSSSTITNIDSSFRMLNETFNLDKLYDVISIRNAKCHDIFIKNEPAACTQNAITSIANLKKSISLISQHPTTTNHHDPHRRFLNNKYTYTSIPLSHRNGKIILDKTSISSKSSSLRGGSESSSLDMKQIILDNNNFISLPTCLTKKIYSNEALIGSSRKLISISEPHVLLQPYTSELQSKQLLLLHKDDTVVSSEQEEQGQEDGTRISGFGWDIEESLMKKKKKQQEQEEEEEALLLNNMKDKNEQEKDKLKGKHMKLQDRLKLQKQEESASILNLIKTSNVDKKSNLKNNELQNNNDHNDKLFISYLSQIRFPHYIRSISSDIAETFIYSRWSISSSMNMQQQMTDHHDMNFNNHDKDEWNDYNIQSQLELNKKLVPELELKSLLYNFLVVRISKLKEDDSEDDSEQYINKLSINKENLNNNTSSSIKTNEIKPSPPPHKLSSSLKSSSFSSSSKSSSRSNAHSRNLMLSSTPPRPPILEEIKKCQTSHSKQHLCMSPNKIVDRILEEVGNGVDNPRIVYLTTRVDSIEHDYYVKALRFHRIEVYTKKTPLVSRILKKLNNYEISLVEKEIAYSARSFLGTKTSPWSKIVALMRLSRKNRKVLPALT